MDIFVSIGESLAFWALGALVVAYLLDYLKGWAKSAPSWLWRVAVVILSAIVAEAIVLRQPGTPPLAVIWHLLGVLAFSQGAYRILLKKLDLPDPAAPGGTP